MPLRRNYEAGSWHLNSPSALNKMGKELRQCSSRQCSSRQCVGALAVLSARTTQPRAGQCQWISICYRPGKLWLISAAHPIQFLLSLICAAVRALLMLCAWGQWTEPTFSETQPAWKTRRLCWAGCDTVLSSNYSRAVNVSPFLHFPNVFVVSAEAVVETIFPEG